MVGGRLAGWVASSTRKCVLGSPPQEAGTGFLDTIVTTSPGDPWWPSPTAPNTVGRNKGKMDGMRPGIRESLGAGAWGEEMPSNSLLSLKLKR